MAKHERDLEFEEPWPEREALRSLFEGLCEGARGIFLQHGSLEPRLVILTRAGLAMVYLNFEEGFDREHVARSIREQILKTVIEEGGEPVHDEPVAVILASEAWMVEYDLDEPPETLDLPPRLHPRRKEILQVTLRTRHTSFCRNWPIVRKGVGVTLGDPVELAENGMESVWDVILTG